MDEIPSTGKACHVTKFDSIDSLTVREDAVLKPGYGEVLLKIHAVSLNYRDVMIANGEYPYHLALDVIPVSDCAGEILALGDGCTRFSVGDKVMPNCIRDHIWGDSTLEILRSAHGGAIDGFLREYAVTPEYCLTRLPAGWSYEEGACIPCAGVTAYNSLMGGGKPLKGGDTVLIQGTGGVSIFALQIAVASGAKAIVISSSDDKLQLAKKLGAHHLINYKTRPEWDKQVLALTDGKGVDYITEVGGPGTLARSLRAVRYGGTIGLVGAVADHGKGNPGEVSEMVHRKGMNLRGVLIGSREQTEALCKLFEATGTRPVIDKVFSFDQTKEAYRHLESQRHFGKVVINVA